MLRLRKVEQPPPLLLVYGMITSFIMHKLNHLGSIIFGDPSRRPSFIRGSRFTTW